MQDRAAAMSYAHGTSSVPLLGETIGENLRRTVERFGDREALVVRHQGHRATYRELWEAVGLAARGLLAHGVQKGDRVGIWSPNRFEWVVVQYATARIGAILVNVNPAYRTDELRVRAVAVGREPARAGPRISPVRLRRRGGRGPPALPRSCGKRSCWRTAGRTCSPTQAA